MTINEYALAYSIAWRAGYSKEECEHFARKSCDEAINYPVPATLGIVTISNESMAIWPSDDRWDYPSIEWIALI